MASSRGLGMIGWWAVARLATQHLRYSGWVPLQGCGTASRTDDSVAAQVGSSREESCVLSGIVGLGLPSTSIKSASRAASAVAVGGISDTGFTVGTSCSLPTRRDCWWRLSLLQQSSSVVSGSGGPIPGGAFDCRPTYVGRGVRFLEDYISGVRSRLAIGGFWVSSEPPTVLGMGGCSRFGESPGVGTGTVARHAV